MVLVRAHRERLARAGLLDLADATREEVEDLEFLLRGGRAQELALAAMGVSLEELGVLENFIAIAARSIVALAAEGRAPPSRKAEATKMLDAVAAIYEPVRGWERALEIVFEGPFHTLTHAKPRERVRAVLELLRVGATDVPDALRNPTPQAINRAAEVIRSFRVTHRKPGRTHLSPAGMARRFVAAFRPLLAQSMKRSKSERSRAKRQKPITA